jgi:hypothetical protein
LSGSACALILLLTLLCKPPHLTYLLRWGVSLTFCLGWPWVIFPISMSWVTVLSLEKTFTVWVVSKCCSHVTPSPCPFCSGQVLPLYPVI